MEMPPAMLRPWNFLPLRMPWAELGVLDDGAELDAQFELEAAGAVDVKPLTPMSLVP